MGWKVHLQCNSAAMWGPAERCLGPVDPALADCQVCPSCAFQRLLPLGHVTISITIGSSKTLFTGSRSILVLPTSRNKTFPPITNGPVWFSATAAQNR